MDEPGRFSEEEQEGKEREMEGAALLEEEAADAGGSVHFTGKVVAPRPAFPGAKELPPVQTFQCDLEGSHVG